MIEPHAPMGVHAPAAQGAQGRVRVTPEALTVIERLRAEHGSLVFFQSGGCCAGSAPICLPEGELPIGENDLRVGEIGGCSFFIDADQYERWGRPVFLIDVSPGSEEGFSLESLLGVHFVSRTV
jgi:uncharacterized protein (DUF779 family)